MPRKSFGPFGAGTAPSDEGWGINQVTVTGDAATAPPPAALPLFAAGLGVLDLLGWRRKWKQMSAAQLRPQIETAVGPGRQ
jgi:hypothetical protein